ncbi:MAG: Bacterial regulatory protein luxR family [Bacteroidota bacterium]
MNSMNYKFMTFSMRENRIINLAKEGLTNKEIALQLNIEESTVKCHRRNVMRKLGIKGKVAFLRFLLNAPQ